MKVAIAKFPGTNCDLDVEYALRTLPGVWPEVVWYSDLEPSRYELIVLPGGFSYGDRLRAGAVAAHTTLVNKLLDYISDGGLVLGICNGFQILVESGILPGALLPNNNLRFICRWVSLRVENDSTPFTNMFRKGEVIKMPIAHQEGRYYAGGEAKNLISNGRVVFTYVDEKGRKTRESNPNGSEESIAGIVNEKMNVLGMMPHPERASDPLLSPWGTSHGALLFLSILNYVRGGAGGV